MRPILMRHFYQFFQLGFYHQDSPRFPEQVAVEVTNPHESELPARVHILE